MEPSASEEDVVVSSARPPGPRERLGRRLTMVFFYGLIAAFCVAATVQISQQVFAGPGVPAPATGCQDNLAALTGALERARLAGAEFTSEQDRLREFRESLGGEWAALPAIEQTCEGDVEDEAALDALVRLRYAEEHALRFGASRLAPLRKSVESHHKSTPSSPHP